MSTVSRGRAGCIRRLVESLRSAADELRVAAPDIQIVLDAGDDEAVTAAIRSDADAYAKRTGRGAAVYSLDDRASLADRILGRMEERACDRTAQAVRFALLGDRELQPAVGAARTCEQLYGTGRIVVSVDDDVVARGWAKPNRTARRPVLADGIRDIECTFYADRDALLDAIRVDPIDIVDLARAALSAPSGSGRIDLAVFGTAGDGGIGHRHFILADQVRVSAAGEADWRDSAAVFDGRELVRVAERPFITRHPFYMTGAAALQYANLLPPFFPNGMPEDGLFGAMVTRLYDDSLKAHVPVALYHDAPAEDHLAVTPIDRVSFSLCRVLRVLVGVYRPRVGGRPERLARFGSWLRTHCERPAAEFADWVETVVLSSLRSYAAWLRGRYSIVDCERDAHRVPTRLDRAVVGLIGGLTDRIDAGDILPISDFRGLGLPPVDQYARMQRLFDLYARALESWSEVVEAASEP